MRLLHNWFSVAKKQPSSLKNVSFIECVQLFEISSEAISPGFYTIPETWWSPLPGLQYRHDSWCPNPKKPSVERGCELFIGDLIERSILYIDFLEAKLEI